MSENPSPPNEGQSNVPPVQAYASYPRAATPSQYSSPEKLQSLMEGYYGLNWAFLALVGFGIAAVAAMFAGQGSTAGIVLFFVLGVLGLIMVGVVSYPNNKKIGYGMGWQESTALWISIGLAIGSCVVSPILVFIVLQIVAMQEIKNYGVKGGFLGVRKKDIRARIEQLRQQERGMDMSAPPPQV